MPQVNLALFIFDLRGMLGGGSPPLGDTDESLRASPGSPSQLHLQAGSSPQLRARWAQVGAWEESSGKWGAEWGASR